MWSNIYDYYELRLSISYSLSTNTKKVVAQLTAQAELEQIGLLMFRNQIGYPWIDLCVVNTTTGNFHCSLDTWTDECNTIPIVCAKSEAGAIPEMQLAFLLRLAQVVGWYLIHEENEEGQEDIILWSPDCQKQQVQ